MILHFDKKIPSAYLILKFSFCSSCYILNVFHYILETMYRQTHLIYYCHESFMNLQRKQSIEGISSAWKINFSNFSKCRLNLFVLNPRFVASIRLSMGSEPKAVIFFSFFYLSFLLLLCSTF